MWRLVSSIVSHRYAQSVVMDMKSKMSYLYKPFTGSGEICFVLYCLLKCYRSYCPKNDLKRGDNCHLFITCFTFLTWIKYYTIHDCCGGQHEDLST